MLLKTLVTSAAFFIIFVNSAFATDFVVPSQKIVGAETAVPLGELVDLTISPIKDPPKHFVSCSIAWKVFDGDKEKRVREYQDGIFFGAGVVPKRMTALAAITYLYVVKEGDKTTEITTKTVIISSLVIIGEDPGPSPDPATPEPSFPEARYNLQKKSYSLAMNKVPASIRKGSAAAVAKSFESMASAVAAGAVKEVDDLLKKTAESNRAAVGANKAEWEPFFKEMQDTLYSLYESKQMLTATDFAEAWREVAAGLKSVK
jgi:hypothetical protein